MRVKERRMNTVRTHIPLISIPISHSAYRAQLCHPRNTHLTLASSRETVAFPFPPLLNRSLARALPRSRALASACACSLALEVGGEVVFICTLACTQDTTVLSFPLSFICKGNASYRLKKQTILRG